jgi:hypothetical protein
MLSSTTPVAWHRLRKAEPHRLRPNANELPYNLIVVRVAANPNPCDRLTLQTAQRAIVIAGSDRETVLAALQAPEAKGGVIRVLAPEMISLNRRLLNVRR